MVLSLFTIIPPHAFAANSIWYVYRWWDSSTNQVQSETRYANAEHLQSMDEGIDDLYSGWYYSESYIVVKDRVTVHGEVNIIITDSSYVQFADGIHVSTGNTLNIYGQSRSDQALEAIADTDDNAAIGANNETDDCGTINI